MAGFVGQHLEEMADMHSARKCKVVLLCSIVTLAILAYYGFMHITNQNYLFGTLNILCVGILIANLWYLNFNQSDNLSDLILSGVLLFQATLLLVYGDNASDRLFWLYPILAAVIFVCDFRTGLILSSAFYLLTFSTCLFTNIITVPLPISIDRFLISLFALYLLCNTSSYFYAKVVNYIQSLYKEGIEDLAYRDQLTGLANRWSFESWALEKLEEVRDSNTITAMVFLDIDNFKAINDTYGHEVGDRVLQHFSKRLRNNIRSKDRKTKKHDYSIARYAGDEFVLLLYDVRSIKDLNGILNRICHLFEDSYQSTERINKLTVSAGVAIFPEDGDSLPELTRCADKAMYAAKHGGKNQYRYYQLDHADMVKSVENPDPSKVTPIKKFNGS
ncbi:GGDEF domain-containing protein [Vibrio sp. Isolate25]|uniref:GGDEF domain-containing protein n=1 Tax=Vibrio sp. Isolate25 TaxID=2908535 RepID=UPI001EFE713E|nr:GGDEF domain-containing protein [Vibrio sp. Isolate25]MCG9595449.1 GGDEF domain-containing protein [Vibrio sp. Isolate25]